MDKAIEKVIYDQVFAQCKHDCWCDAWACCKPGHKYALRNCPEEGIGHLLAAISPYLAVERPPSPPLPCDDEAALQAYVYTADDKEICRRFQCSSVDELSLSVLQEEREYYREKRKC